MPPTKPCPVCGHICYLNSLIDGYFGYECHERGNIFGVYRIMIGWKEG